MKLLYVSYWGIRDVLAQATVVPNLRILAPHFAKTYLATIERTKRESLKPSSGITHVPFYSWRWLPRFIEKGTDILFFYCKLLLLLISKKIDVIVCRGSSAAIFGVLLHKVSGTDFIVESFEPHADYMLESHVWALNSLEYKLQKWIELETIRRARYLLPVSKNYYERLKNQGVSQQRLVLMPCCVDMHKFRFDQRSRKEIRRKLNIAQGVVTGIYVGKFGDIYLKEEAFQVFQHAARVFSQNFFLIILTPHPKKEVEGHLRNAGFDLRLSHIDFVDPAKVPEFLSASDFAFSLIRPSPSRKYCSPIKNGEYWANGLPIILTAGVGDDAQILEDNSAGIIIDFDKADYDAPLLQLRELIGEGRLALANRIMPLAAKYRGFELVNNAYATILNKMRSRVKNHEAS